MLSRKNIGSIIFDVFNVIFLVVLSVIFLAPFIHVIMSSISDPVTLLDYDGIVLWPKGGATLKGYQLVFSNQNIYTGYVNTLFYVVAGTALNLIFTTTMAYVLSRKKVMWNNVLMFIAVFTMFFSGGLIPFYLQVRNLGLYDTRFAIILPGMVNVWNLIIMRTSFSALPESLSESARIDGAGHLTVMVRIVVPLSKAVISVIALFYIVGHWNAWFNAAIFLRDRDKYPLQLILREILIMSDLSSKTDATSTAVTVQEMNYYEDLYKYCTIIVATLPILLVYPFIQKYFTKGVMVGSIKG